MWTITLGFNYSFLFLQRSWLFTQEMEAGGGAPTTTFLCERLVPSENRRSDRILDENPKRPNQKPRTVSVALLKIFPVFQPEVFPSDRNSIYQVKNNTSDQSQYFFWKFVGSWYCCAIKEGFIDIKNTLTWQRSAELITALSQKQTKKAAHKHINPWSDSDNRSPLAPPKCN